MPPIRLNTMSLCRTIVKSECVKKLKEHLLLSKVNHEEEILNQTSLKYAHIYCILHSISAQQYGPFLEKYIISNHKYKKNNASECIGDYSTGTENVEVKASLGGVTHTKFNYVQIRLSQNISTYLFTAYYLSHENVEDEGDLYIFKVPKEPLKQILLSHGGYAHGTKKEHGPITLEQLHQETNMKEYSLRPSYKDACWKDLEPFRISESEI